MIKQDIKFDDLDGNEVEETFYFHLSRAEISKWALSHEDGDLQEYLTRIVQIEDKKEIIRLFDEIVSMSIGKQSEDRRRFLKSPEITSEFMQSGAYDKFFMRLLTDTGFSIEFINGVMPKDLNEGVKDVELQKEEPAKTLDDYTQLELLELPDGEFGLLMTKAKAKGNVPKHALAVAMRRKVNS